jgi:RNA ligase
MNYSFPEIRTINDVLPHIEGRNEFNVNDKGDFITVNYAVAFEDTFAMTGPDDLGGAIRRECRGLKFYPSGKIAARPFHKFFNIGEKEETQPNLLDFSRPHTIMTKEDGSFVHPIIVNGIVRWCTKAGITEVSELAEAYVRKNKRYEVFGLTCLENGLTPLFEYVGPYNKVVLDYDKENIILLAVRKTIEGTYQNIHKSC